MATLRWSASALAAEGVRPVSRRRLGPRSRSARARRSRARAPGEELPGIVYSSSVTGSPPSRSRAKDGLQLCEHAVKIQYYEPENHLNLARVQLLMSDRRRRSTQSPSGLKLDPEPQQALELWGRDRRAQAPGPALPVAHQPDQRPARPAAQLLALQQRLNPVRLTVGAAAHSSPRRPSVEETGSRAETPRDRERRRRSRSFPSIETSVRSDSRMRSTERPDSAPQPKRPVM